jgi:hypothetical protein
MMNGGDATLDTIALKGARCAIYWGTTRGLFELAETGPTKKSMVSARADITLRKVTAVLEVTPVAQANWEVA